jgi:molybdopterin molybdotransferase
MRREGSLTGAMLHFEEARARLLADVPRLPAERVPLWSASGRVLAEEIRARTPLPPFAASAMDGYAVSLADLAGDGPWALPVRGESRAGALPPALLPGACARIFTGAPLPDGADAVVMQEVVERDGERALFRSRPAAREHIRPAGDDLAEGAVGLTPGTRLGPAQLSLAAMLDRAELRVSRRPRVVLLATGDELRLPGSAPSPATIPESNTIGLAALAAQAGAEVCVAPPCSDEAEATALAIAEALRGADLLVTVGGVSVGDHDVVRPALERAGVQLDFWRVAIKPGKPLAVGRSPHARVLGLPGNPVSALVTFALFGVPLLRALQGDARPVPTPARLPLGRALQRSPGRMEFLRAAVEDRSGEPWVVPLRNQSSGAMISLARCDALAVIPTEATALHEGDRVETLRLIEL